MRTSKRYAAETSVSPERSRGEIESTLARYGATRFMYGWQESAAVIGFEVNGRRVRFVLPLPQASEFEQRSGRGRKRAPDKAIEQATRQRWRALSLAVKAKLETVEAGIATFEDEFMAYIVLPSGQTVGEWMSPQIEQAYKLGQMPPLLPMRAGV